jgi:hypothetical protein
MLVIEFSIIQSGSPQRTSHASAVAAFTENLRVIFKPTIFTCRILSARLVFAAFVLTLTLGFVTGLVQGIAKSAVSIHPKTAGVQTLKNTKHSIITESLRAHHGTQKTRTSYN